MAQYTKCPRCGARYEVTTCPDGTTLVCDVCGYDIVVTYETENVIPGGLTASAKVLADGSKWLDCPKCGFSTDISSKSPGNRFRCSRCNLLLQVPLEKKERKQTRALRGEDLLTCPGCKTKYDISGFTPGNRFRCRSCGLSLKVPERGEWTGAGEWEIDVEKGLIKCNGCGKSYPISNYPAGKAFECSTCRKAFTPSVDLAQIDAKRSAPGAPAAAAAVRSRDSADDWELDIAAGMVKCTSCLYTYDISGMKPGADFVCPRCQKVFRMPARVKEDDDRVGIVCQKCGAVYDVSGYLRGTMFSCEKCDAVIMVGGRAKPEPPAPAPPAPAAVQAGLALAAPPAAPAQAPAPAATAAAIAGPERTPAAPAAEKPSEEPGSTAAEAVPAAPAAPAGEKKPLAEAQKPPETAPAEPEPGPGLESTRAALPPAAPAAEAPAEPSSALDESVHDLKELAAKPAAGKVLIVCESCGQKYRVPPIPPGKKKKCRKCGGILRPLDSGAGPAEPEKSADELADEQLARFGAVEVKEIQAAPPADETAKEENPAAETAAGETRAGSEDRPDESGPEPPRTGEPEPEKAESGDGSSEKKKSRIRKKHKP